MSSRFNVDAFKALKKDLSLNNNDIKAMLQVKGIGVSIDTIKSWTRSSNPSTPSPETIKALAEILSVSVSTLDEYVRGELYNEGKGMTFVPLIGRASCGTPQEYDLNGYEPVPVTSRIYNPLMYAVEAEGDSMEPKISNGDIVYCDPNRQIENGNIVHYSYEGESGIKKYKVNEAGTIISLVPLNPDYDIITIDEHGFDDLKMAKVVGSVDMNY